MSRLLPGIPARWCMGAASAVWLGALVGIKGSIGGLMAIGIVLPIAGRWWRPAATLAVFCALGLASGWFASIRSEAVTDADIPTGSVAITFKVAEDASTTTHGIAVGVIRDLDGHAWDGPRIGIRRLPHEITVGHEVSALGTLIDGHRRIADELVAGIFTLDEVVAARASPNPLVGGGNAVRRAVRDRYNGAHRADGLLSGFLTGDTDRMLAPDTEDLRRAGLSHFVAVSGSNVSLFLAMWWIVTAPLSIHRRLRALVGGVGLMLFVVVTRWEPSVIRAGVMAAVPLVGSLASVPVDPWMALGVAVTILVLASGHLVLSVGFQLSVLATAGVLGGLALARGRRPRWLFVPLFATVGAQMAVGPLLLAVFGTVPLFAPVTNLFAGPVVAASTVVAALGVIVPPVAHLARFGGSTVLWIAAMAADGPQLGAGGVTCVAAAVGGLWIRAVRPLVIAGVIVVVAAGAPWSIAWPRVATLTALDVGQGDAILIQDPSGSAMLIDGGSDPRVLDSALRRHGVRFIETVVVTHNDNDHAGGLADLVASNSIGTLIVSAYAPDSSLVTAARDAAITVRTVRAGARLAVGATPIRVVAPSRRFASDNDGSIVLMVDTGISVLLPGDIEAVAQHELPPLHPEVMVVPHHGSATTDLDWLADTVGDRAILSYGPNRYGHPHPTVVELLGDLGVTVARTPEGDISILLRGGVPGSDPVAGVRELTDTVR
ncbi:MAG: ComEC/Rec2 family competence protein [Acidimicrobiia bacterium]